MKKFAVYSKVKLVKQPAWLNKFKKEFVNEDWHVTLKQTCWVKNNQISDIKNKLKELHKELKFKDGKIDIDFNKIVIDEEKEEGGKTIMIRATNNKPIHLLQKKVVKALRGYNDYNVLESKIWEKIFKPHLTLASNLKERDFERAQSYIKQGCVCKGIINGITFIHLNRDGSNKVRINYKFYSTH